MLLTAEQLRILSQRIEIVIELARYYPAEAQDSAALIARVLRFPFTPQEHNSGRKTGQQGGEQEGNEQAGGVQL